MNKGNKRVFIIALSFILMAGLFSTVPLPGQVKKLCCISGKYAGSHVLTAKPNCPRPVKETFTMVIKQKEPCAAALGGTISDASGTVSRWTGTLSPGRRGCCLLEGSSISPSGDTVNFKGTICLTFGKWKIKGTWEESGSTDPCRGSGTWEASQI